MKYYIGIIGLILLFSCNEKNIIKKAKTQPFEDVYIDLTQCNYKDINDSLKIFSFENEIDKVLLVTYKETRYYYSEEIPVGKKFTNNNFQEEVFLDDAQINLLKNVYFGFSKPIEYYYSECYYQARHCIFFLNKKMKIIAYHEICFECSGDITNNPFLKLRCYKQFDKMKDFFKSCGIKRNFF